jgi:alcohol dehydrogenase
MKSGHRWSESGFESLKTTAAVLREMGAVDPYAESRPLVATELQLDEPGPGELVVRVRAAGLCHSDLSVIKGTRPRIMPMALGHEAAGEVVATGSPGSGFMPGDHVVLAFVPACGDCRFCRQGRPALCLPGADSNHAGTLLGGGIRQHDRHGSAVHHHLGVSAFSEYIVVSERSAVAVREDLPFEIAALFGCAVMTGAGAVVNTGASALPARSIAVFGLGGVGLAALLAAASTGPEVLVAVDPVEKKRTLALELGATHAFDPADPDCLAEIRMAAGDGWGAGVDIALETVGSEKVLAQAWAATGRGGTTITTGLPHPEATLEIPALSLTAEERTLKGSYLGSCVPARDIPRFIEMYREGRLPVDRLLSHRLTPDQLNEGFDRLSRGEAIRQVVLF